MVLFLIIPLVARMVLTRLGAIENTVIKIPSIVEDSVRKVVKEEIQSVNERSRDDCHRMVLTQRLDAIENIVTTIPSTVENSVRKVVKEEIQAAKERGLDGANWNGTNALLNLSNERNLHLKFFGEPGDALTGKEIRGKGNDGPIRVAIVDEATGTVVESGPESSAKVEIFLKSENDNEGNRSHEDVNSRIIMESHKTKLHLAKHYHVYLKKGVGDLSNVKLANDKSWSKSCECRLGARVVGGFSGIKVSEAWSEPFKVSDSRGKLYSKHHPPSPSDPVWRLLKIGKDGRPCKRLRENNVTTVEEFLLLHYVEPERLKIVTNTHDADFQATVDHALTCKIDDKKICVYKDSLEPNMSVVFDDNKLKGVIRDSQYVLSNGLSEAEMKRACKLMSSACENPRKRKHVSSETILETLFPCGATDDVLNTFIQGSVPAGCNPNIDTSQAEASELVAAVSHQLEEHDNNVNPAQENLSGLTGSWDTGDMLMPDSSHSRRSNLVRSDVDAMFNSFLACIRPPPGPECQLNPVSETNANQERGIEGFNGGGAGRSAHFSPCRSRLHPARNTRIQDTVPGYNLTIPQNSNHCQTTDSVPSIRPSGEAINDLDFESLQLATIVPLDDLSPNDFRTQGYKDCEQRDIPSLTDEVCRLANICKDGDIHKRLQLRDILTVEHFLIQLLINPQRLKSIVQMEAEEWMATVKNARACRDKKVYVYMDKERKVGIAFTFLGKVLRLFYQKATSTTPDNYQAVIEELLASAYKNWAVAKHFNDETSLREYLIELNKHWDPMDSQVLIMPSLDSSSLNPDREFGSKCFVMDMEYPTSHNLNLDEVFGGGGSTVGFAEP